MAVNAKKNAQIYFPKKFGSLKISITFAARFASKI
jgi:hypothetical protein